MTQSIDLVTKVGYDPGEWIEDWVRKPITNPTLALPLGITGSTGTGKSNFAWGILWDCVKQGDCVIIPGDASCEFRHFLLYTKTHKQIKTRVIIPKTFEYEFFIGKAEKSNSFTKTLESFNSELIVYDYHKESINDFIEPNLILVVFDACFNLESKSWFWQYNLKQLKYRKRYHYLQVTYCFPEGSTYFPNTPFKEQYKPVYIHSKDFVEYRKFYMRGIYLYHHSSMLFYLLEKQFETIIKKGSQYEKRTSFDNKLGRGKAINEYSIYHQGIEDIKLELEGKFQEMKELWKVIPDREINFDYTLDEEEKSWLDSDEFQTIDYWLKLEEDFPDIELDVRIEELIKWNPNISVNEIMSLSGKGNIYVNKVRKQALLDIVRETRSK